MPKTHPAIDAYCVERCPSQADVLALLIHADCPEPTEQDSVTLAAFATMAGHRDVLLDHAFQKARPGAHRGMAIGGAMLYQSTKWMGPVEDWLGHLDQAIPGWTDDLVAPGENGLCGWDLLLFKNFSHQIPVHGDPTLDDHALMARVAALLELRQPEKFDQPHPIVPGASRAQVWAWFWLGMTMRNSRLPHLGYLLARGIDPDFCMPVDDGRMSMGSAALWAMSPVVEMPHPARWPALKPCWTREQASKSKWHPDLPPAKDYFNSMPVWQALSMLRQAGMDASRLVEPTAWTYTALGLLARRDSAPGQWTTEFLGESLDQLNDLGLDLGVAASSGRTLLDLVGASSRPLPFSLSSIDAATWSVAATSEALDRFWCTPGCLSAIQAEPRLVRALIDRVFEQFDGWNQRLCADQDQSPNQDIKAMAVVLSSAQASHPLSALGTVLLEQIHTRPAQDIIQAAIDLARHAVRPNERAEYPPLPDAFDRHASLQHLSGALRADRHTPAQRTLMAKALLQWASDTIKPDSTSPSPELDPVLAKLLLEFESEDPGEVPDVVRSMLERAKSGYRRPIACSTPVQLPGEPGPSDATIGRRALDQSDLAANPALLAAVLTRLARGFPLWGHPLTHQSLLHAIASRLAAQHAQALQDDTLTQVAGLSNTAVLDVVLRHAATRHPAGSDEFDRIHAVALRCRTRPSSETQATQATSIVMDLACALDPSPADIGLGLDDRARLQAVRDASPEDPRAVVMLYSEESLLAFGEWARARQENDSVKAWRETLIGKDCNLDASEPLRYRVRRLAQAHPALAALERLREAFPHFEDVISQVNDHLCLAIRGDGRFSLPPLLMAGPPGTGKTFFFQELAAQVDTTYRVLNMEGITGGFAIVGLEAGWSGAAPGIVFDTLMKQDATANPIILLDEVDKLTRVSNAPVGQVLLTLLEAHTARRFADRCIALEMDVSRINWVATANDLSCVDLPLKSRFNIVHVANPDYHARRAMARHIYRALRNANTWGPSFSDELPEETLQALCRPASAARDLRKNLSGALAAAARANRTQLLPDDLPAHQPSSARFPWDAPLPEPVNAPLTIRPPTIAPASGAVQ